MQFTRGDTYKFKFQRKDASGNVITTAPAKLYFTVKYDKTTKAPAFQKSLGNGITFDTTEGDGQYVYHCLISPEDTETLPFGDYTWDIEVTVGSDPVQYVQTIAKGTLTLLTESTWAVNKE